MAADVLAPCVANERRLYFGTMSLIAGHKPSISPDVAQPFNCRNFHRGSKSEVRPCLIRPRPDMDFKIWILKPHYAGGPRRPPPPQLHLWRSRDPAHASIPLAQTPRGLTGRAGLQAGAQQAVLAVDPSFKSLGIDSRNDEVVNKPNVESESGFLKTNAKSGSRFYPDVNIYQFYPYEFHQNNIVLFH